MNVNIAIFVLLVKYYPVIAQSFLDVIFRAPRVIVSDCFPKTGVSSLLNLLLAELSLGDNLFHYPL